MVMFFALYPMESIFFNLFILLEHQDSKFQVRLKSLLCQGLSEPEFYDALVYKLNKIVSSNYFQRSLLK